MAEPNPYLADPHWSTAEQVTEAVLRRFPADVMAVGAHGSSVHRGDTAGSDVQLLVVTYRPGSGPRPVARRVGGLLVDVAVSGGDELLRQAATLSPDWPLVADRYVNTRPLHDPTDWLTRLRDTHLTRLTAARNPEFTALARQAWCRGFSAHTEASRLAEWYQTDAALLRLSEARLAAATVVGLLTRTYYRSAADAVIRAGVAGADIRELGTVLARQADELTARGRPVDGTPDQLFDP
ncbi:MAG TPA: nucleotidyltransferase domain-containing protein [Micromonospora sp.]